MKISPEVIEKLYWEEFKTLEEIGETLGLTATAVNNWMKKYGIPRRVVAKSIRLGTGGRSIWKRKKGESFYWNDAARKNRYIHEHQAIMEEAIGRLLKKGELIHHRDGNPLNNHLLNLELLEQENHTVLHHNKNSSRTRPSLFEAYLGLALVISKRSTCKRLEAGAVITDHNLKRVLSIGYNGNARGLANECDSEEPGNCGCVHAETNAISMCGSTEINKVLFLTHSPCLPCAKLIVNSGFLWVYYMEPYRKTLPLAVLHYAGVKTCPYPITSIPMAGKIITPGHPLTGEALCPCGCGKTWNSVSQNFRPLVPLKSEKEINPSR